MLPSLLLLANFVGCVDYNVVKQHLSDTFAQPARETDVDILWVVDNSATMSEERALLAEHADAFATVIAMLGRGFHLAVTTTDAISAAPGTLAGPICTDDTAAITDRIVETLLSIPQGSRDEKGFATALAASDPSGLNPDFARVDADLEIIVYSDEDDQSDIEPAEFLSRLMAARPGRRVSVSAVVGDPPDGCFSLAAAADPGLRYIEAQQRSLGLRESICSGELDIALTRIAMWALQLEDTFYLSEVPNPETLEVRVDRALIPARTPDGWTYDASDNSIHFDGYAVPPPGSAIMVQYDEWLGSGEDTSAE